MQCYDVHMSALEGKVVVLVGDPSSYKAVALALKDSSVTVLEFSCESTSIDAITSAKPDLILIFDVEHTSNHDAPCMQLLGALKNSTFGTFAPVIVAVPDNPDSIEEVLLNGATDYITPGEHLGRVMQKIKLVLGIPDNFSGAADIDISARNIDAGDSSVRVLTVEDDPLLRNLLSIRLARSKFPFEFSSDGEQALIAAQQFKPDVIVLDLMLPRKSGFEVLDELKSDPQLAHIPVVVFSNRDSQDDKQRAMDSGASAFYVKATTDLSDLMEHIISFVHNSAD